MRNLLEKMMSIKQLVDNPSWQELRSSLLGTWKKEPEKSLRKLRDYLGDMNDKSKVKRVLNYLNALHRGGLETEGTKNLQNKLRKVLDVV